MKRTAHLDWSRNGKYVGQIYLTNRAGTVDVSDPCYTSDVWCRERVQQVHPGFYDCYVECAQCGVWGRRVARILIVHGEQPEDTIQDIFDGLEELEDSDYEIDEDTKVIGVDSGMAGFFDTEAFDFDAEKVWDDPHTFYGACCKAVGEGSDGYGIVGHWGFVSSTGFGDGGYTLRLLKDREKEAVIAMELAFLSEEDFYG